MFFTTRAVRRALGLLVVAAVGLALAACGNDEPTGPEDDGSTSHTLTFSSQPRAPIPDEDSAGISDGMDIPTTGKLQDVKVDLEIAHTWVGDLEISLEHVSSGTTLDLLDNPNANSGDCTGEDIGVTLDDRSSNGNVQQECQDDGAAYPAADYAPAEALSALKGQTPGGTWRLHVSDLQPLDVGTLEEWAVEITVKQGTS